MCSPMWILNWVFLFLKCLSRDGLQFPVPYLSMRQRCVNTSYFEHCFFVGGVYIRIHCYAYLLNNWWFLSLFLPQKARIKKQLEFLNSTTAGMMFWSIFDWCASTCTQLHEELVAMCLSKIPGTILSGPDSLLQPWDGNLFLQAPPNTTIISIS